VPARKPPSERKDKVIQTRVNDELEELLKAEAKKRRLPVSQLIRNVLEDTFELVGNVVDNVDTIAQDAISLGRRAGVDARSLGRRARSRSQGPTANPNPSTTDAEAPTPSGSQTPDEPERPQEFPAVFAWQEVLTNGDEGCASCRETIARGAAGFLGMRDDGGPRTWLCARCRARL